MGGRKPDRNGAPRAARSSTRGRVRVACPGESALAHVLIGTAMLGCPYAWREGVSCTYLELLAVLCPVLNVHVCLDAHRAARVARDGAGVGLCRGRIGAAAESERLEQIVHGKRGGKKRVILHAEPVQSRQAPSFCLLVYWMRS